VLRAAVAADVDMIVTGDKDLLESGIERPRIISPADFVNL
jgi:predicted nucleic acid-binding protein